MNCPKCGAELKEGAKFCESCGAAIEQAPAQDDRYTDDDLSSAGADYGKDDDYSAGSSSSASIGTVVAGGPIKERSIPMCIILSFITCGIYTLYWIYCLNDEVSWTAGEQSQTSGAMVVILSLVTCNIYTWYWLYKKGEETTAIKENNGLTTSGDAILFLILGIFGLSIISLALMQDTVNKYGA